MFRASYYFATLTAECYDIDNTNMNADKINKNGCCGQSQAKYLKHDIVLQISYFKL